MKKVISLMFVVGICLPVAPPASCTMAHYANRDRCVRKDLNYTMVCSSPPMRPPTSEDLNLYSYKGSSGLPKAEDSTGKN